MSDGTPTIQGHAPLAWHDVCHAYDPRYPHNSYSYVPSLGSGIAFCVLFGLSTIAHVFQAALIKVPGTEKGSGRQWWMLVFAVGALTELLGWAGRAWSSQCPYLGKPFLIQISTLIIGKSSLIIH